MAMDSGPADLDGARPPVRRYAPDKVAGFVLAGGKSSRMGSDKAVALFLGRPLIANALTLLGDAGVSAKISRSREDLSAYADSISDIFAECGPLGGIHAALSASDAEMNLFLPVDMPLLPASLLVALIERSRLTRIPVSVATRNGQIQPFPVVLTKAALPEIERLLHAGQASCYRAWQEIPRRLGTILAAAEVEALVQSGRCSHPLGIDSGLWFDSANTPADLIRLSELAARVQVPGQISAEKIEPTRGAQVI